MFVTHNPLRQQATDNVYWLHEDAWDAVKQKK